MKTNTLFKSNCNPKLTNFPVYILTTFFLFSIVTFAQIDTTKNNNKSFFESKFYKEHFTFGNQDTSKPKLTFKAYADFGYVVGPQKTNTAYDPISRDTVTQFGRRDYTSYPLYANQFSLAYAYVQAQYEVDNKYRLRMAYHTGHTVDALYAEETPSTKFIRELSIYYHFNKKWAIEAGIFPSYFGAELVLSKENLHATRAYIADFSPDYEAGVRLYYKHNKYNNFSAMVLNGWQVMRESNGTKPLALGWHINNPGKIVGDWLMFFGNEQTYNVDYRLFRHYQNIYYRIWLNKKIIIYFIAFYYVFKFLARLFLPLVIKKVVEKAGQSFQQQYGSNTSSQQTTSKRDEIILDRNLQKLLHLLGAIGRLKYTLFQLHHLLMRNLNPCQPFLLLL